MNTWKGRLQVLASHFSAGDHSNSVETNHTGAKQHSGIILSPDVKAAIDIGRPVVALESTIVSHGMPYPQNLHTALQVEDIIRQNGATPATIAIIEGQCHVGLTRSQLQHIAKGGKAVKKVSRRNLSYVMAMGIDGATTVSATMLLAARAGIHLFVTGGIGGVHRGAERTMDISADLTELGKTPVLVVCAGAKSVLDISLTLEYLETQGVCVGSYKTDEFPAFFTRHSGCNAPCRFDTPEQIAAALHKSTSVLGLEGGMVLGVPIPESSAAVGNEVEGAISQALEEAERGGVTGDDVTPFLLKRIQELTGGRSLEANIALVKNNALVGAQIAVAFNKLLQ